MQKFTDRFLQSLKADEKEYTVREGRGFAIRVLPSGLKTFQYIYNLNGRRFRLGLGNYPDTKLSVAHQKFHDAHDLVKVGINPKTHEPVVEEITVEKLVEQYLEKHSRPNKSDSAYKEDERTLNKYVIGV